MELPDRQEHDDEAAAILALVLATQRRKIRDAAKPPNDSFWAAFQSDLAERLGVIMFGVFVASVRFHSGGSERDQQAIDAGLPWATERARYLAGLVIQTSRKWLAELQLDIERGLLTDDEIQQRLDRIFGQVRADTIASDAVTTGQTGGGEWVHRMDGTLSPEDRWKTHPELSRTGPCPICAPLDGTPRSYWELLFPDGPPNHARCVCEIIYSSPTPTTP